jgi:predicted metal-dependent peptidase
MDITQATKALDKAKLSLLLTPDSTFFATLAFSLEHQFDDSIQTACCNGKKIRYNPEFFMGLSPEERLFVLLHEVLHAAYLHGLRFSVLPQGQRMKWNMAADHVINLQLQERGFKMPDWVLKDPQYSGMSTEEVYKLIPDDPNQQMKMADLEMPPGEDPGSDSGSGKALQEEMKEILVRAALQSKMAGDKPGTIPGEIEIFLENLLNPKLPWHQILRKYMQAKAKTNYSWVRPNRRFFPKHHLPSIYGDALSNITIAVDASGSVTDADFLQFVSETHFIVKTLAPEKITFIQFDTRIISVDEVKSVKELANIDFKGRGGTCVNPVLEWANENKPQLLLVFTDGEFNKPKVSTKVDTVWVIHNNKGFKTPFGKTIHYEI